MTDRLQIVFDASDAHELARFWARAVRGDGLPRFFFKPVPEPKVAKNRCHIDLLVGPDRAGS